MPLHIHFEDGGKPGDQWPVIDNGWPLQVFTSSSNSTASSRSSVTAPANSPTEAHSPNDESSHPDQQSPTETHSPANDLELEQQPKSSNQSILKRRWTYRDLFCRRRPHKTSSRPPTRPSNNDTSLGPLPRPTSPVAIPGRSPTHPLDGNNQVLDHTCTSDGLPLALRPRRFDDGTVDYGKQEIWVPWQIDPWVDQCQFLTNWKMRQENEEAMRMAQTVRAREKGWTWDDRGY